MKKTISIVVLALATLLPVQAVAQNLKTAGKGVADIVPGGWESTFKQGDLNHDGIADLVVIATPCNKEKMKVRNDGYVYNFNQPVLAIYWGKKGGGFSLFKQYGKVIPARASEFLSITPSVDITSKGVLKISIEYFASAGSWEQPATTYQFRYQNGDFFLIGKDENVMTRNTGKTVETSENYLTGKRCVTTANAFNNKKPVVKWSRLPKAPLKALGFSLEQ